MKKYLHNIMNIRLLMIALLAIVCNTSKADDPVDGSPLNPWWDSNANGYVLRTIDDEHTVLDAMKALQEINDWSYYSNYTFYLAEDVDLDGKNWIPLGTSSNPCYGYFYCYKPTYAWYSGPENQASIDNPYPKVDDPENKPELEWKDALKYTFNIDHIKSSFGKTKYIFSVSDIESYIEEHSEELDYSDIDGFISTELESILYKRTEDGNLIVITDNLNSPLSDISNNSESFDSYNDDIEEFIQTLSYYFVEYDENTLSVTMLESDMESATILSSLTPTASEQAYYKLLPYASTNLGYFYDENNNGQQTYYTTDGHIGTCKIMNMTVEGEYDGAGFFGVVSPYCEFHGFTFENCSVTNEKEDGYAGILYGYCGDTSDAPDIYNIFIGQSESRLCYVKADYAGGIYGSSDCENPPYIYSAGNMSSYTFDPELSPYIPDTHEGAYYADDYDGSDGTPGNSVNKIYVSITASKRGNKISSSDSEANNTYVYADGIQEKFAFGKEDEEYGEGTQKKPFIISSTEHLLHLQSILNGINEDSYKYYEDLKDLDLSTGSSAGSIFDGCYFKQTDDIDFGDVTLTAGIGIDDGKNTETEAGPFAGTYDGNGHTIKVNIHINEENRSDPAALFANTYQATIKNLCIKGTNINDYQYGYAAGIVGYELDDYLTLKNCLIDVTIEAKYGYALIGSCLSTSNLSIQDSFNKGAKDLEWFSGANSYFTEDTNKDNTYFTWPGTYGGPGAGVPDSPLQISSLAVFNTEKGKKWAEYGLAYELTDNIVLQNTKLVDPDGDYIGPNDASNENYYIEKFCGTLIGGHYDDTSSTNQTHIIAGLTDKALFGTITGDSKIEKIGFVNCYNASNQKVKLAKNIADGATVSVQECYTDGYFDFVMGKDVVNDNTIIDSYSYSDIDQKVIPIKNFKKMGGSATWENDAINPNRQVITSNCIRPSQSSTTYYYHSDYSFQTVEVGITAEPKIFAHNDYTDAISTIPVNNCIWRTTDPRMQFKYNVINTSEAEQVVRYMYLTDVTALSKTSSDMTDDEINSLGFDFSGISPSYNGVNIYYNLPYTVDNIYYRRIKHNDWESVSLPFAYSLSDIKNSSNFKAYTYSTTDGESEAKFTSLTDANIQLGQPVLFFNTDNTKYDFIVKKSNPDMTGDIYPKNSVKEPFYGVLHTAGYKGTFIHMEDALIEEVPDGDKYYQMANIFKISGSGTATTGTLLRCAETSWIYPFRAYLKLDIPFATPTENNAKSIRFSIFDDNTTSIDTAELATKIITTDNIYSLDGRKVSAKGLNGLKAGLYIMNGKKFVVK